MDQELIDTLKVDGWYHTDPRFAWNLFREDRVYGASVIRYGELWAVTVVHVVDGVELLRVRRLYSSEILALAVADMATSKGNRPSEWWGPRIAEENTGRRSSTDWLEHELLEVQQGWSDTCLQCKHYDAKHRGQTNRPINGKENWEPHIGLVSAPCKIGGYTYSETEACSKFDPDP